MNTLVKSLAGKNVRRNSKPAYTANGAETLDTSGHAALDMFAVIGSLNDPKQAISLFIAAYREDKELAGRVSLWSRDVRGGAGRRAAFRAILQWLEVNDFDMFQRFAVKTPELGRWDDLFVVETDEGKEVVFRMVAQALTEQNGLCAKWLPRKGKFAAELRNFLELSPKNYRRLVVSLTNVVETRMCAREFSAINFNQVPSVAGARYSKAFRKHDPERYQAWLESLKKAPKDSKTVKINVDTLFPYDVKRSLDSQNNDSYAEAAWAALPDYFGNPNTKMLPIIDTSGSMTSYGYYERVQGSKAPNVSPMDVAVSLGVYCAERNSGPFKNCVIPFSDRARFVQFKDSDTLRQKFAKVQTGEIASTNLLSAFKLILETAVKNNVDPADMPTHLLIISDMEFNQACVGIDKDRLAQRGMKSENFIAIEQMYQQAGYARPRIIFWNVNGRAGNNPVRFDESGTAMVAGFSPAIAKAALSSKEVDPLEVMLKTVEKERYAF